MTVSRPLPLSAKVFLVCGLWLVALVLYFVFLAPPCCPKIRATGSSVEANRAAVPGLKRRLGHVVNVMGGFMVATGALTVLAACRWLAKRELGIFAVLAAAGAAGIGLMSSTNFFCTRIFDGCCCCLRFRGFLVWRVI